MEPTGQGGLGGPHAHACPALARRGRCALWHTPIDHRPSRHEVQVGVERARESIRGVQHPQATHAREQKPRGIGRRPNNAPARRPRQNRLARGPDVAIRRTRTRRNHDRARSDDHRTAGILQPGIVIRPTAPRLSFRHARATCPARTRRPHTPRRPHTKPGWPRAERQPDEHRVHQKSEHDREGTKHLISPKYDRKAVKLPVFIVEAPKRVDPGFLWGHVLGGWGELGGL